MPQHQSWPAAEPGECERGHVDIRVNARGVAIEAAAGEFRVVCSAGEFAAGALVGTTANG